MKYVIVFVLFVCNISYAASPASIESFTIAGRTRTNLQGLKILICSTGVGGSANASSCIDNNNSFYVVPTGLQFRIIGLRLIPNGTYSKNWRVMLGYHTGSLLGVPKLGTCFGPSGSCGDSSYQYVVYPQTNRVISSDYNLENNGPVIPGDNYPWVSSSLAQRVTAVLYGYEELP